MGKIAEKVKGAQAGSNPFVICRMPSGWAVMGKTQVLEGYSLLLPDPVVGSLNDLGPEARALYLRDMGIIGDAILEVTGCLRINYEILGNTEPELHAHCFARYSDEAEDRRLLPIWGYFTDGLADKVPFSEESHGHLRSRLAQAIQRRLNAL